MAQFDRNHWHPLTETGGTNQTEIATIETINKYSEIKLDSATKKELLNTELFPNLSSLELTELGWLQAKKGNYDEAISFYDFALKRRPEHSRTLQLKGYSLQAVATEKSNFKLLDDALDVVTKSIEIDNYRWAYYTAALVYWKQGKKKEAGEHIIHFWKVSNSNSRNYLLGDDEMKQIVEYPSIKNQLQ